MTENLFLIKYGEIALKKGNRGAFVKALKDSIKRRLPARRLSVFETWHRIYVRFTQETRQEISEKLSHTFGIVSFSEAVKTDKDNEAIDRAAVELAGKLITDGRGRRFKIEVKRADKTFPTRSYQLACRLGDLLTTAHPDLVVDVHHPDWILMVEIREFAYLYGPQNPGPGGLPSGSSGRGMLLLSGGIDSPVAGYLMAKRGLLMEAVYFHSAPFVSERAREKVASLAKILSAWVPGIVLHVVDFTPALTRISERAHAEEVTLLMRACMMRIASALAARRGAGCLVTGESLGQVASQTIESISYTGTYADRPVFRPCIGMDKEEIVTMARRIGTFDTSNLPFADCCVLFSPVHPLIHPVVEKMHKTFEGLELDSILEEAVEKVVTTGA